MLSLEECRQLIDGGGQMTDEEMLELRANLYETAQLAFDVWVEKKRRGTVK